MKINWKLFLIGFSLCLYSCVDVDRIIEAKYIYQNNTDEEIELVLLGDVQDDDVLYEDTIMNYEIPPNEDLVLLVKLWTNEKKIQKPLDVLKINNILGDSIKIIFGSGKTEMYYREDDERDSIYRDESYVYSQTRDYEVEFLYRFED